MEEVVEEVILVYFEGSVSHANAIIMAGGGVVVLLVMLDMVVQVVEQKEMLDLMEEEQDWEVRKLLVVLEKDLLVLDLHFKVEIWMLVQVVVDIMVEVVEIMDVLQMVQVVVDQDIYIQH